MRLEAIDEKILREKCHCPDFSKVPGSRLRKTVEEAQQLHCASTCQYTKKATGHIDTYIAYIASIACIAYIA